MVEKFTTRNIEIETVNDKPELKEGAQITLKPIKEEQLKYMPKTY